MVDLYLSISEEVSRLMTQRYSTSFGMASRLFAKQIRQDIYNIYGFVRVADEIVDTYTGKDRLEILDAFEQQTYQDLTRGYSTNPVIHAFVSTCLQFGISKTLIAPFIESMRMDTDAKRYTVDKYQQYIYGSAEVVGLMCLKVFCQGDNAEYKKLEPGARALGAAYQKVNFLRDIHDDYERLGRYYFPVGTFKTFDEATKEAIVSDISADFATAKIAIEQLPASAQKAVKASYVYYSALLQKLKATPAERIKQQRIRVADWLKVLLLVRVKVGLL